MAWTESECKRQGPRRTRCATCKWWFDGTCRKRSPWLVSGQVTGGQGFDGVWPRTPSDSWCGDFAFGQDI